jgi:cation transport ATPase
MKQQALEEVSKTVVVFRDGGAKNADGTFGTTIHRNHIRTGDIIKIQNGMNIPVDGIVV